MEARGFRIALLAGFGGILLIFLVGIVDALRLLDGMQQQNAILHSASADRSKHLASVRYYLVLSSDMLAHPAVTRTEMSELESAWSRTQGDLEGYSACNPDEQRTIRQLTTVLGEHRQNIMRAMTLAASGQPRVVPILEVTTRLQDVDAKQLAWTEDQIQKHLAELGTDLGHVLELALGAALLLAVGCLVYILRVERHSRHQYQEMLKSRGDLAQLSARLVEAQETERRSISRELHDEVGQTLSALLVDAANLAQRIPAEDAQSRKYLDNIRSLADTSVNSLRDIALLLRPSMLDDLGLIPALEWQAREISRRHNIKVKVNAENVSDALPDPIRTCIYRVTQEALHNVASHSKASSATVSVRQTDGHLTLTVEDDGQGFDPQRTRGLGLLGIEERVKQLDGTVAVESNPARGTILRVTLPVHAHVLVTG
jgi:signal transduction histidine kinase